MKKLSIRKPSKPSVKTLSFKNGVSLVLIFSIVVLGACFFYWYKYVLTDPQRILNGMLDKSLQTTAVSRTVSQSQGDSSAVQTIQTSFTPKVVSKSVSDLSELNELGRTKVTTETIGTADTDYVQYTDINIANPQNKRDFKGVLNTWGKRSADTANGQEASFLNTALFVAVPFGNLNPSQRAAMKNEISKNNLYKYKEAKLSYEHGRPVMQYDIDLSPKALVTVLAKYTEITGIGSKTDLDPSQYEGVNALSVKLTVDVLSRHIKTIDFQSSGRVESYQAYSPQTNIVLPTKTINVNELQSKLSSAEGGSSQTQQQ